MGTKFYSETEDGGIVFKTKRRIGDVRIPNYVYDMWMPLLGAVSIGVYAVYCRLERAGTVKSMSMRTLAGKCRIGVVKLEKINAALEECGFIEITKPEGHERLMHWTTEIVVCDPPQQISAELIAKYKAPSGYGVLCPWLKESCPNGSAENANQVRDKTPNESSKIESLGLQPSIVEPPSADLVKPSQKPQESPPLEKTEKLLEPESEFDWKNLPGVEITPPDKTIPIEYIPIDLSPWAKEIRCTECGHTQPWPKTRAARRKWRYLICEDCGGYFRVAVEGDERAYALKLPERVWQVAIPGYFAYPCTEKEFQEFAECWRIDHMTFTSVMKWWMGEMYPRQPIKHIVIARCIAGWHSRKKKEPVVPEPEITEIDCPEWFE